MAKATSLFKYRKFDKTSIELLINKELWFSNPESLNDPFECQRTYSDVLDVAWEKYNASKSDKIEIDEKISKQLSDVGICSFSRTRKNQLMWSHYADEHKGFCIGFNKRVLASSSNKFHSIEVDYQSDLPHKKIIERFYYFEGFPGENNIFNIASDILFSIIGTKYSNWKYEKETRLIRPKYGPLGFSANAINSIAFGLRMPERDKATLYSLLSGVEWKHIKWYQAEKSKDKFALVFTEIKI